jgi:ABC-2 type transport system permease protein
MVASIARLLRLWRHYGTMDALYLARGPQVAIPYYLSDVVMGIAALTGTFLLAERFDGIGPWTRPQVLFLLGYALLVRAAIDVVFNYNLAFISRRIGRGQLDHLLIQPQPLWMALVSEGFAPLSGSGMLLPSLVLLFVARQGLDVQVTPLWLALFVVHVVASAVIVLAFEYAWGALAFWAPRAAEEINSSTWQLLTQLAPFPLEGLSGAVFAGLVTLVPVGLIAWLPARVLLGMDVEWWSGCVVPAAAILLGFSAWWVFGQGMRQYRRTGSTRYLQSGHRR